MAFSTNANPETIPPKTVTVTVTATATASSPWTQTAAKVIRGESDPIPADAVVAEEGVESGNVGGVTNAWNRSAWKKQEVGVGVIGPVMGAHAWPALSDAARVSTSKAAFLELSKQFAAVDNSTPVAAASQGTGSVPLSPRRQGKSNSNTNSTHDRTNAMPSRQKSNRRNANSSSSGGVSHPPAQQASAAEGTINNPSPRDHTQKSGHGKSGHGCSQSHGGGDHPSQRANHKNNNGNHNNNVGKTVNGKDAHLQPQRLPQRFPRHPPPHAPSPIPPLFPPPIRSFGYSFNDFQPPMCYVGPPPRGMPFIPPMPHPMFLPLVDPELHSKIVKQIDYYFSNENLVGDVFLRQNMDKQGWVSIKLIAGFKKVLLLTNNIHLILDALRTSTVVEVQGDKLRSRLNWRTWVPQNSMQLPNVSVTQGNSVPDVLAAGVQNVSLDANNSGWSQGDVGRAEASFDLLASDLLASLHLSNNNNLTTLVILHELSIPSSSFLYGTAKMYGIYGRHSGVYMKNGHVAGTYSDHGENI
ncbi:hypothetical protein ACFE04_026433 [Oxalis oulophora]